MKVMRYLGILLGICLSFGGFAQESDTTFRAKRNQAIKKLYKETVIVCLPTNTLKLETLNNVLKDANIDASYRRQVEQEIEDTKKEIADVRAALMTAYPKRLKFVETIYYVNDQDLKQLKQYDLSTLMNAEGKSVQVELEESEIVIAYLGQLPNENSTPTKAVFLEDINGTPIVGVRLYDASKIFNFKQGDAGEVPKAVQRLNDELYRRLKRINKRASKA